ncbi:unnamed protein product [Thlaspi arvense]|uniref:Squalene synthase n=1 Tax=Thlaspi arvense TaxID=13288 RepID=A0AAU9T387_THLAR|nr:unnamed protein product [Thlaspi arvense]
MLVCVFYLILRALDTVEDDTSIPVEIKVPILIDFHRHMFDRGTEEYKVETVEDYDEYCHYAAGLVGLGLAKLILASGLEDSFPDWKQISISSGSFLQKTNIIRDYLEDINEIPKSRMFWPREIWGKYVDNLEDFKNEGNSTKAVQCLNEMVTNALIHVEDSLKSIASLRNPAIFRSCAIPQILAIGTLANCYNNLQVFRGVVKLRRGLMAKVFDRLKTMDDAYGAFYDFSCMLEAKVDKNDPNAMKILNRLITIKKVCRENGVFHKRIAAYLSFSAIPEYADCNACASTGHIVLSVS